MASANSQYRISSEIEKTRLKMVKVANQEGFTSKEAIKISRDLDKLLNYYQELQDSNKE
ncbi:aspartyl-phosphate phosphatase Spo0E family protein [Salirhabdus sp. Marseille-P4669]|uniref:aspartyl-phosphate phosphatase Spo0E family protein n=1 Tax=Salirhabdus sp. Marseille-P4669 TaxID=2042310 RepID=UPI001F41F035|nr:aspartyl-phosphate phosphatase Spo0E family protein [Salirhabdus sp. Marseille-P4669]